MLYLFYQFPTLNYQILQGLQYIHEDHLMVHCNVNPESIMLGEGHQVKLSDFGESQCSGEFFINKNLVVCFNALNLLNKTLRSTK